MLLYPSGLDFVAAFFGCLYAGVIAVPAYPPRRNRTMARIDAIANDAEAQDRPHHVRCARTRADDDRPTRPRCSGSGGWATDSGTTDLADQWQRPDVHGDTLAFLQYTSGSTGTPKGVMLTHANLMHNSAMITYAFEHSRSGSGVLLAAALSRHGADRRHPAAALHGPAQHADVADRLPAKARCAGCKPSRSPAPRSAAGRTSPTTCASEKVTRRADARRSTSAAGRWRSTAPSRSGPTRSTASAKAFADCGFRREAFYPCYGLAEATLIVSGGFKQAPPVVRSFDAAALEKHEVVAVPSERSPARASLVGSGGNLLDQNDRDRRSRDV